MSYNYKRDLDDFFKALAKPAGSKIKNKTMNEVGEPLTRISNWDDTLVATYFVDMEGGYHREDEFNGEQLEILHYLLNSGKRYPFVCYPDIPAEIMEVLVFYADNHDDAMNRLPLWKLARSGITDRKAMWVLCYILECGVTAPDHLNIKNKDISHWISLYDQFFTGKKIESEFKIENLPNKTVDAIKKEASRLKNTENY